MGIDYSLCLIIKREDSDLLLENLCTYLDSGSRERITLKQWSPESESKRMTLIGTLEIDARGIAGIKHTEYERPNSYCFSLQVQLEREFETDLSDHQFKCFERPDSFGCMWTSIYAGNEYLLLEMTAATSSMSSTLRESQTIHRMWTYLASKTNALFAYIYLEEQIAIQLFPIYGDLRLPDYDTLAFEDDSHFSIDRMVNYLLATN